MDAAVKNYASVENTWSANNRGTQTIPHFHILSLFAFTLIIPPTWRRGFMLTSETLLRLVYNSRCTQTGAEGQAGRQYFSCPFGADGWAAKDTY